MKYTVYMSSEAQADLEAAFLWLQERTLQHAPEWYNAVADAINSLEEFPDRCPVVRELSERGREVRELVYGPRRHGYRIIFEIHSTAVHVLHIRHGARQR